MCETIVFMKENKPCGFLLYWHTVKNAYSGFDVSRDGACGSKGYGFISNLARGPEIAILNEGTFP